MFDEWKCGLLLETGGVANKQIEWELKFSVPWARFNTGEHTRHLGGGITVFETLGLLETLCFAGCGVQRRVF